jgi:aspartyl-tRNA synthetase
MNRAGEALKLSLEGVFGKLPLIQSRTREGRQYVAVGDIDDSRSGQTVWIRARIHTSRLQGNKLCFLVLRQRLFSIQAVLFVSDSIPKEMVLFAGS